MTSSTVASTATRRALLAGSLGAALSIAVTANGSQAQPASIQSLQNNWRFCVKCYGMFYWGYPDDGRCPAGGAHSAAGFNFQLPYDVSEGPNAQANWRFCTRCYGMFFWGYPDDGRCPASGSHSAAGFNFVIPHA